MSDKCYDCGSTLPRHHTRLCDLADPRDFKDLSNSPGTQYWDKKAPSLLTVREGVVLVGFTGKNAREIATREAMTEEARQCGLGTSSEVVLVHAGTKWLVVAVDVTGLPRGEEPS